MGKTTIEFIDLVLLIIFLAMGAMLTVNAIAAVTDVTTSVAEDKVTITGANNQGELTYTVGDIIMMSSRFDTSMPMDKLVLQVNGVEKKSYDCNSVQILSDTFLVAKDIVALKPSDDNMDMATYYKQVVEMSLATESLEEVWTLNIILP